VGLDPITGTHRFTLGLRLLQPGIPLVPVLLGLFGISEALVMLDHKGLGRFTLNKRKIKLKEALSYLPFSLYYALLGTLVGVLPGAGTPIASFLSYSQAVKRTKNPVVAFGQGAREGIIAPETANNACVGGALIPMLSLGIPGDGVSAIILSVFMVHGLKPGPLFMSQNYDIFILILKSGALASLFLLLLGLSIAPHLGFVAKIKNSHLAIIVIVLSFLGAYSYNYRSFDILIMVFFGFLAYVFKSYKIPTAPLVLGLVLGPMMDANFRRSVLLMGREGMVSYMLHPITLFFLGLLSLLFLYPHYKKKRG
jgi:putative tricarboxylic transport membrane protein